VSEYKLWAPTKPEDEYENEEIQATALYQRMRESYAVPGVGGMSIQLSEDRLIPLARDAIREMWKTLQVTRYNAVISAVFAALDEGNVDHGNDISIKRDENGVCRFELPKAGGRKRFSHDKYAHFIGRGTPHDSDLYRESVKLLREKCGKDASALRGGFLLNKTQMRSENKNGVFELVIESGHESNGVTDKFVARIYQHPFTEQCVPTISFPPASGKKDELSITDEVQEVPSMSQMVRNTITKGTQTPAVIFGLVELFKKEQGEGAPDADAAAAEEPVVEERPRSAAHALLDDDDE